MTTFWDDIVLVKGNLRVTIALNKQDKRTVVKDLILTKSFPKSSSQFETDPNADNFGPTPAMLLDLLRVEQRITISGSIIAGLNNGDSHTEVDFDAGNDTSYTCSGKETDLFNMVLMGGIIHMTYKNEDITVNIDKLESDRLVFDGTEPGDGEVGFDVTFTAIKGVGYGE